MSNSDKQKRRLRDTKLGKRNTRIMIIGGVSKRESVLRHGVEQVIQENSWSYNKTM